MNVVQDFVDVFVENLPGLTSEYEVEFFIDLLLSTMPLLKTPYHMSLAKLKEFKI